MRVAVSVAVLVSLISACKRGPAPPAAPKAPVAAVPDPGNPVAAGALPASFFHANYSVILPAGSDPEPVIAALSEAALRAGYVVTKWEDGVPAEPRFVALGTAEPVPAGLQADRLDDLSRGLDDDDRAGVRAATQAVLLGVYSDVDVVHLGAKLAVDGAEVAGGWIVDATTGDVFTPLELAQVRSSAFVPHVHEMILVTAARDGETMSLVTYGLSNFALPELVLRGVPLSFVEDVFQLVNATAQLLIEQRSIGRAGAVDVDLAALTTWPWTEMAAAVEKVGGSGKLSWTASWIEHDSTPAIELVPAGDGELSVRFHAMIAGFFGVGPEDDIAYTEADDPELLAARERARKEIDVLAPKLAAGVPDGDRVIVKAPFETDDGGVEWMWVEVQTWKAGTIQGILVNQPAEIAKLAAGARVEVKQAELYDYVYYRADGTELGGETNRILMRRHEEGK